MVLRGDRGRQRPIEITYAAKAPNFKSAGDVILRRMEEAMARFGGFEELSPRAEAYAWISIVDNVNRAFEELDDFVQTAASRPER